jgi:ferredoxin
MSGAKGEPAILDLAGLDALVTELHRRGYRVFGPTVRDRAIVLDDLEGARDLPVGWGDEHDGGHYRLRRRSDQARFGYASPATAWRRMLLPPRERLWSATLDDDGFTIDAEPEDPGTPLAFVGVRACDLHAIDAQDRVFAAEDPDPTYGRRRRELFVVAVNCGEPGATCFCASMGTGPQVPDGFDLALTELIDEDRHEFLVDTGSNRGAEVLAALTARLATAHDLDAAAAVIAAATTSMGRVLETDDLPSVLARNLEHPRWDDVASRCLACTNCTLVCPTCFCHSIEDVTDVAVTHAERWRRWDSCFTLAFTEVHGGAVRSTIRSRYRQWLTHKLGTWWDQFGASGCVGCGRCITWCPAGIDITEEIRSIRDTDGARADPRSQALAAAGT